MLDTNICIYIIKNKPQSLREKFREFDVGDLCISSITVSELYFAAYKSLHIEKNLLKEEEAIQILEDLEDMRADEEDEI